MGTLNALLGLPDKGSHSLAVKVLLVILVVSLVVGLGLLVPEPITMTNALIILIALVAALLCAIGVLIAIFMARGGPAGAGAGKRSLDKVDIHRR